MTFIYARITNLFKFKYQTVFSARIDKQNEANQILDETEFFNTFNFNHKLTESEVLSVIIKFSLKHQIQQQAMKKSGWRFDKII